MDRLVLLDFKKRITEDPLHVMSSWNDSIDLCSWVGVTCNRATKGVVILNLMSQKLLGSLLNLNFLLLDGNNLSGTIPGWIGNFSSLRSLFLSQNNFQGNIPNELGHLTVLWNFSLGENNLPGMVPSSIYNISSPYIFSVIGNHMHGELPPNVGVTLPNLQAFYCGANNFTGPIPPSFSNASRLQILNFAFNGFPC
ncbi:receptor-like protein 35 [Malus sylvestris]|uniref:receptor-like protein 35 n=1 Tax=Malus sylvestris TaxID=3752 RepID=UPI0021AC91DD|nr:receptor-like protein 35 [Malus sylvestris]